MRSVRVTGISREWRRVGSEVDEGGAWRWRDRMTGNDDWPLRVRTIRGVMGGGHLLVEPDGRGAVFLDTELVGEPWQIRRAVRRLRHRIGKHHAHVLQQAHRFGGVLGEKLSKSCVVLDAEFLRHRGKVFRMRGGRVLDAFALLQEGIPLSDPGGGFGDRDRW